MHESSMQSCVYLTSARGIQLFLSERVSFADMQQWTFQVHIDMSVAMLEQCMGKEYVSSGSVIHLQFKENN
jgi:hypothetical protein